MSISIYRKYKKVPQKSVPKKCTKKVSQKVSQSLGNTNNWSTEFERRLSSQVKSCIISVWTRWRANSRSGNYFIDRWEIHFTNTVKKLRYKIQLWLINTDYGCIITMFAQESGMAKVVNIVQIVMLRNTSEKYCWEIWTDITVGLYGWEIQKMIKATSSEEFEE